MHSVALGCSLRSDGGRCVEKNIYNKGASAPVKVASRCKWMWILLSERCGSRRLQILFDIHFKTFSTFPNCFCPQMNCFSTVHNVQKTFERWQCMKRWGGRFELHDITSTSEPSGTSGLNPTSQSNFYSSLFSPSVCRCCALSHVADMLGLIKSICTLLSGAASARVL